MNGDCDSALKHLCRSRTLDLFKSFLVLGMVVTHDIQITSPTSTAFQYWFSEYVNLITFSGFMFAFGVGVGLSGGAKPSSFLTSIKKAALFFCAYGVSACAYLFFVEEAASWTPYQDALLLTHLGGYSEFLASFAVLAFIVALIKPQLQKVATNPAWIFLSIGIGLLANAVSPLLYQGPLITVLIGNIHEASFPIIQYAPLFLIGIYYSRKPLPMTPIVWTGSLLATACLALAIALRAAPFRSPPDALWVVASFPFLLAYWRLAQILEHKTYVPSWLALPGQHLASIVVISNLVFFYMRHEWGRRNQGDAETILIPLALIAAVCAMHQVSYVAPRSVCLGAGRKEVCAPNNDSLAQRAITPM